MTKLLAKAQTITETYINTTKTVFAEDREGIGLIVSQLSQKKCQLDSTIASAITMEQELEEVGDAEIYHFTLMERILSLRSFLLPLYLRKHRQQSPLHNSNRQILLLRTWRILDKRTLYKAAQMRSWMMPHSRRAPHRSHRWNTQHLLEW